MDAIKKVVLLPLFEIPSIDSQHIIIDWSSNTTIKDNVV